MSPYFAYMCLCLVLVISRDIDARIDLLNGTSSSKVAVATDNLVFRTELIKNENVGWWYLSTRGKSKESKVVVSAEFASLSNACKIHSYNRNLTKRYSCVDYNKTHYSATITLQPILEASVVQLRYYSLSNQFNFFFTVSYCPTIVPTTSQLVVISDKNAVHNRQAHFNCSRGELYAGSSLNPDYYRTCQFDATWSGEMPQCWIEPSVAISVPGHLVSGQNVSFHCVIDDGYPNLFNATLSVLKQKKMTSELLVGGDITLSTTISSAFHRTEVSCVGINVYKETIAFKKLDILFGPIQNTEAETNKVNELLVVTIGFESNPATNKTTTSLIRDHGNDATTTYFSYEIDTGVGTNQYFTWAIDRFTKEDEGNYTFTAWSPFAPEIMVVHFQLRGDEIIELEVLSSGVIIGIAVSVSLVLIFAILMVVFVRKRRESKQLITAKQEPNREENISDAKIADEPPAINPYYETQFVQMGSDQSIPEYQDMRDQKKEIHNNSMAEYVNTSHVTYMNIKKPN